MNYKALHNIKRNGEEFKVGDTVSFDSQDEINTLLADGVIEAVEVEAKPPTPPSTPQVAPTPPATPQQNVNVPTPAGTTPQQIQDELNQPSSNPQV